MQYSVNISEPSDSWIDFFPR